MSQKLQEVNRKLDAARDELAKIVTSKELDLDSGYALLATIKELEIERNKISEIDYAVEVLKRNGVVFKVWDRDAVLERLAHLADELGDENMNLIADHAVQGDDWSDMGDETADEDSKVWAIIKGTANDHPEWFTAQVLRNL